MKTSVCVCACFLATAAAFVPPATCVRQQSALAAGNGVSDKNDPNKASRFRVNKKSEGASAVRAFEEPAPPKSSGGGFLSNLFGGGGGSAPKKIEQAAKQAAGAVNGATKGAKPDVKNSTLKASRFRVDRGDEGKTAIRAYEKPSPSRGPSSVSSASWNLPNGTPSDIKKRAEQYMKGAISATDMARTLSKTSNGADLIGTMPDGEKRRALFKLFTQF